MTQADMIQKISAASGKAIALTGNDIDTDRIIPARFLKCVTFDGLGDHVFEDDRSQLKEKGEVHPFDDARFQGAEILVVNKNFGCGSSREHAPQAIKRWGKGIQAIIGESFAEIFFGNCVALGIPCCTVSEGDAAKLMIAIKTDPEMQVSLDIVNETAVFQGQSIPCKLPEGAKQQFLTGSWDATATLLADSAALTKTAQKLPYLDHWGQNSNV